MACCGRGRSKAQTAPPSHVGTPPALPSAPPRAPSPPPQPKPVKSSATEKRTTVPTPPKTEEKSSKPAPSFTVPEGELPKCRFREFKSKQIIGGREIENYFCNAFSINVRQEHCRVCQKYDK
jgi:hypothetical protein